MNDYQWIADLVPAAFIDGSDGIDATTIGALADRLDLDRAEVSSSLRGVLRVNGVVVPPFKMRTNTWRVDLPAFECPRTRTVVSGEKTEPQRPRQADLDTPHRVVASCSSSTPRRPPRAHAYAGPDRIPASLPANSVDTDPTS